MEDLPLTVVTTRGSGPISNDKCKLTIVNIEVYAVQADNDSEFA